MSFGGRSVSDQNCTSGVTTGIADATPLGKRVIPVVVQRHPIYGGIWANIVKILRGPPEIDRSLK
jgi:hypothetical protein